MMPNVSQVPTIFSFQRIDFWPGWPGWRGSLDEVVNNPLELDLLRDFPWVLGVKLGPKSPSHSCSGLKLSVLENYEGGSLSRERRITSAADFLAWRGCHPGQKSIL